MVVVCLIKFVSSQNTLDININNNNNIRIMSWEMHYHKYIAAFESSSREDFSVIEHLFDNLYHEDYTFVSKDGRTLDRETVKELNAGCYSMGLKLVTFHFKRIGYQTIDVLFPAENNQVVHVVYTIKDNKLYKGQVLDDSITTVRKQRRASRRFHVYNECNKYHWYQTEQYSRKGNLYDTVCLDSCSSN